MTPQEARQHAREGTVLRDSTGVRWVVASCTATHVLLEQPGRSRLLQVPMQFCQLWPEE